MKDKELGMSSIEYEIWNITGSQISPFAIFTIPHSTFFILYPKSFILYPKSYIPLLT